MLFFDYFFEKIQNRRILRHIIKKLTKNLSNEYIYAEQFSNRIRSNWLKSWTSRREKSSNFSQKFSLWRSVPFTSLEQNRPEIWHILAYLAITFYALPIRYRLPNMNNVWVVSLHEPAKNPRSNPKPTPNSFRLGTSIYFSLFTKPFIQK